MEQTLANKLESIESKVRRLASKLKSLENQNFELKKENKTLKNELIHKNTELFEYEKRTKAVPLTTKVKNRNEEKRSKKLKKEIAQYIKEIDKCIVWLQNS